VCRVPPPPAGTVALTAFRELPDGRGRQYTESWFADDPWRGCEHFIRMCGAIGLLLDSGPGHAYALLDVIDEDGGILATTTSRTPAPSGSSTANCACGSPGRTGRSRGR
jgi:hypothetical protein